MTIETLFCLGPIAFLILAIVMIRNSSKNSTSAEQSGHYKPVVKSDPNTTSSYRQPVQEDETHTTDYLESKGSDNDDDYEYDDDDDDDEEKEAKPTFFNKFVDDISRPFYKSSKDDEEEDE